MIYLELLIGFLKVGLFSFGGAYGAIPLISEVVLSYGWMTEEQLTYMIAVSESTPGPIMVNLATFIGSTEGGLLGAVLATLAVILPAFLIILIISVILKNFVKNRYFQAVLGGLNPCIIGLITATGVFMVISHCVSLTSELTFDIKALILTAVLAVVLFLSEPVFKKKISPVLFIIISAVLGIGLYAI